MTTELGPLTGRAYPVAMPDVGEREVELTSDAVRSTWISSTGRYLEEFESRFARACEVEHAIAVANGTVALHLALVALGIGPGDEVIVPSLTYIASANAITYTGATPVFADVRADTWCIDPDHVSALVTPRTRAILPVHLYGTPCDMGALQEIATRHGLAIVEDAAEAPFASWNGTPTGGLGTIGTFSFFGNKILSSGEGGAVTTNDTALASRLRLLRGQGMDPNRRYYFPIVGYNYRLTNVAGALLCAQLDRRHELVLRRRRLFDTYDRLFRQDDRFELQTVPPLASRAPWLYSVLTAAGQGPVRDSLMAGLGERAVETRPLFIPLHQLPPYAVGRHSSLPVTEDLSSRGFSLPTSSTYSPDDAVEVVRRLREVMEADLCA